MIEFTKKPTILQVNTWLDALTWFFDGYVSNSIWSFWIRAGEVNLQQACRYIIGLEDALFDGDGPRLVEIYADLEALRWTL